MIMCRGCRSNDALTYSEDERNTYYFKCQCGWKSVEMSKQIYEEDGFVMSVIDAYENWRSLKFADRARFLAWVGTEMAERQIVGEATYPGSFHGDPIEQGKEEMFDGLFYLYKAGLQKEELESRVRTLEGMLGSVSIFLQGGINDEQVRVLIKNIEEIMTGIENA